MIRALFLLLCTVGLGGFVHAGPSLQPLTSPATSEAGESSLVRGPDGTVYHTYAGSGRTADERGLWLSTLAPGADAWTAPRLIVSTPLLMENWADFATLAVTTDGTLWVQWFQRPADEEAHGYSGWFARSADGGATWTEPAPLGHEFVSLAPLSGGRMLVVWLESARVRDANASHPAKDPLAPYAPSMRLMSRLLAPDGSTLQDWIVDADVCNCCQTTLAMLPGDQVLVAYRGHQPDETRDNSVASFDGSGWNPPHTLHADGWKVAGCPVNGPATDAVGDTLAVAWFTATQGVARVQAKFSPDGGKTFGPAIGIDLGRPIGRLDLVSLPDGSAVVSWLESHTEQNEAGLYVRRIFRDGGVSAPLQISAMSAVRSSGFPRMATQPGDGRPVIISWTDAIPADPGGPQSPAATRVLTARFKADVLSRDNAAGQRPLPGANLAVVHADRIEFLEICAVPETNH